jgi:uncharacterized protein (TIGR03435 family)
MDADKNLDSYRRSSAASGLSGMGYDLGGVPRMNRFLLTAGCLGLGALTVSSQTPTAPAFEVATVKPAAPDGKQIPSQMAEMLMSSGDRGSKSPERIDFRGVTLKMLLQRAYNLKPAQISGPGWMESERYDIAAKVPPATDEDGLRLMLQGLLIERFQIKLHRETKTLPVYLLTVAKGGPKLKPPPPPLEGDEAERSAALRKRSEEMIQKSKARIESGDLTARSSFGMNGTTEKFAAELSNRMDRLVKDMTQLNGVYRFSVEYVPDGASPRGPNGSTGPSLFQAVDEQLGLRLQSASEPVEVLVIDQAEKTPTSN